MQFRRLGGTDTRVSAMAVGVRATSQIATSSIWPSKYPLPDTPEPGVPPGVVQTSRVQPMPNSAVSNVKAVYVAHTSLNWPSM